MEVAEYIASFSSPLGTVTVRANEEGMTAIVFGDEETRSSIAEECTPQTCMVRQAHHDTFGTPPHLGVCISQLQEYFAGERTAFHDLPLVLRATDFQRRVWDRAADIPFGQTISYGELARSIGSEDAGRAVGTALNRNALAIIIPCHRIVSVGNGEGGYASGAWRKEWLLKHEREC